MNQAFFTLSLGIGSMEIFGSYIDKKYSLTGEAGRIILLDTFVAIMSGLIIFPACFAYDVNPGAGPELLFITMPNIFNNMAGSRIWSSLFFVFMSFAALSTLIAVFENIVSYWIDTHGFVKSWVFFAEMVHFIETIELKDIFLSYYWISTGYNMIKNSYSYPVNLSGCEYL